MSEETKNLKDLGCSSSSSSPDNESKQMTTSRFYNSNQPSSETIIQKDSEYPLSSDSENQKQFEKEKHSTEILDDDEVFGFKLPEVDWDNLEAKLKEAQIEINTQNQRNLYQNSERDEIRRKLAIVSSSSSTSASSFGDPNNGYNKSNTDHQMMSDYLRKSSKANTNYLGQNLQICFMNELQPDDNGDDESGDDEVDYDASFSDEETSDFPKHSDMKRGKQVGVVNPSHISNLPVFSLTKDAYCDDLLSKHVKLQAEIKEALLNVPARIKFQLQSQEVVKKKASPIADIVGLKTYGQERLTRAHIVDMNIGQLQVIANDLFNQIENTNEDLTTLLTDRDDLSMQQDSFLVDIEDLSKRIQEYSLRLKNNTSDENSFTSNNNKNINSQITNKTSEKLANDTSPPLTSKLTQLNNMIANSKSTIANKLYSLTRIKK